MNKFLRFNNKKNKPPHQSDGLKIAHSVRVKSKQNTTPLWWGGKPNIRRLKDMKEVIFDKKWLKKISPDFETYYMYRGVYKKPADKTKMEKAGLRYDITIIPAKMFGREFPKTLGHYHSQIPNSKFQIPIMTYPEIYEVLGGKALYFFQKLENKKITKVLAVKAEKGDKIIVPPNYGHITANIGKTDLVMANWMAKEAQSDYKDIIRKKGGAYYALKNGKGTIKWVKNKNYSSVPKIKFIKPSNYLNAGFSKNKTLYNYVNDLKNLEFLKNPLEFQKLWKKIEM